VYLLPVALALTSVSVVVVGVYDENVLPVGLVTMQFGVAEYAAAKVMTKPVELEPSVTVPVTSVAVELRVPELIVGAVPAEVTCPAMFAPPRKYV
jgi:hypothetical protein